VDEVEGVFLIGAGLVDNGLDYGELLGAVVEFDEFCEGGFLFNEVAELLVVYGQLGGIVTLKEVLYQ
jgi:hypothetical protein